jgi:hypothetical protein
VRDGGGRQRHQQLGGGRGESPSIRNGRSVLVMQASSQSLRVDVLLAAGASAWAMVITYRSPASGVGVDGASLTTAHGPNMR